VLCKNFGIAPQVLKNIPPHEKYIFRASVPPSLEEVLSHLPGEQVPSPYTFHASQVVHTAYDGGTTLVIDDRNFPVTDMAAAINTLEPGAIREMHWHPHADEWFYVVSGHLRVTVFNSVKNARTWDFFPGDVGFIPKALGHYIENVGDTPARLFNVFNHPRFADVSLYQWLALTPPLLVKEHLNVGDDFINALSAERRKITK